MGEEEEIWEKDERGERREKKGERDGGTEPKSEQSERSFSQS